MKRYLLPLMALVMFAAAPLHAQKPEDGFDFSVAAAQPHPRILLNDKEFKALSKEIKRGSNPDLVALHGFLMKEAETELEGKPLVYGRDKSDRRIRCGNSSRIIAFAYAWRFTRDKRYLRKAEEDMLAICNFPDWVPEHYLGTAAICEALALTCDWMYGALPKSTLETVSQAVKDKGFDQISVGRNGWWYRCNHNWNQVCNAGVSVASVGFYEYYPDVCEALLRKAVTTNRPAVDYIYSPGGASPEGPGYWAYGTGNQILLDMLLEHTYGTDFGLSDMPGFSNSGRYILYVTGNLNKSFNYSDNNAKTGIMPDLWYFARRFNQPGILFREKKSLQEVSAYSSSIKNLVALVNAWMMGKTDGKTPEELSFAAAGATPVFTTRTGWDKKDFFLGIKGGMAKTNHAHMDAGSFVFDAYGYRWSMDYDHPAYSSIEYQLKRHFGKESLFNMKPDAKRWRMMIFNNRAHSTLTVNDKDHKVDGFATMTDYFSNPGRAGARFDLTPVFGGDLEKAERTGAIVDGDRIEITDHLKAPASAPAHIRWTMLTPARPEITPDGIMLVQKKEKMLLRTSGAPVRYTQWSTDPMDYDSPTREFEVKVANTWLVGFELDLEPGQEVELVTVIARGK